MSPFAGVGAYGSLVIRHEAQFRGVRVAPPGWGTSDAGFFLRGGLGARVSARVRLVADTHLRVSFVEGNRRVVPGGGVGVSVHW